MQATRGNRTTTNGKGSAKVRDMDAEKPHKHHHAKQAGPKAKKREESVKKKKGTLEQSKKDHKNTRVR